MMTLISAFTKTASASKFPSGFTVEDGGDSGREPLYLNPVLSDGKTIVSKIHMTSAHISHQCLSMKAKVAN